MKSRKEPDDHGASHTTSNITEVNNLLNGFKSDCSLSQDQDESNLLFKF